MFVNFRQQVNARSSRGADDEISGCVRKFLINYEILNGVFDKFLIFGSEIFLDFGIKRGIRKLPQSFFLVKVGPPNNYRAAFVGRFDNYVIALTKIFKRRPLFRGKVGKFSVTIEFKFVNVVTAFFGEKI